MAVLASVLTSIGEYIREAKDLNQAIIADPFDRAVLEPHVSVVEGVKAKQEALFLNQIQKVLKKDQGCDPSYGSVSMTANKKMWDPKGIEMTLTECYKDIEGSFNQWATANGYERPDLTQANGYVPLVIARLRRAIQLDFHRLAWFADTQIQDILGGGSLKNGEEPNYDQTDGLWKRIFAGVTSTAIKRITIAKNAAANYAAQALAPDEAQGIFLQMVESADSRMYSGVNGQPFIKATRSMILNYKATLRSKNLESSFSMLQDGQPTLAIDGVPIFEERRWDDIISEDFDNGTRKNLPHRAVLAIPGALQVGVDTANLDTNLDAWYDKKDKRMYMATLFQMDTLIPQDFYVLAAY